MACFVRFTIVLWCCRMSYLSSIDDDVTGIPSLISGSESVWEKSFELVSRKKMAQILPTDSAFGTIPPPEASTTSHIVLKVSDVPLKQVNVSGRRETVTDAFGNSLSVSRYFGIPFAVPPLDNLRYQRPVLKILEEDLEAVSEPEPCPQFNFNGQLVGEEDCLYLNLHTPEVVTVEGEEPLSKLPVLIWYHGESIPKLTVNQELDYLSSGSASELSPDIFLINKVVVVTPQYRLGSLGEGSVALILDGFLSTVNEDLNGNMGLFDQLLVMEWVQRYISYFGGDPQQVTLMGHGGSANSLGLLTSSDLARGLFHRIILMSGSPISPIAIDQSPKATFAEIARQNSCPSFPTVRFVRCMQQKEVADVIGADKKLKEGRGFLSAKQPVPIIQRNADGRFLPPILSTSPLMGFTRGNFETVPLLLGVSSAEMAGFLPNLAGKTAKDIPSAIFANDDTLKQFIRGVLSHGSFDVDMVSELVSFEYFSGLNVTARTEQATDLLEEVLSDYLFNVPAVRLAKLWSRLAPVYFYLFDHVPGSSDSGRQRQIITGPNQASHGSDLNFLTHGFEGNADDRQLSEAMLEFWVNFIHKGSPLNAGIDWPQFREDDGLHMVFRERLEIGRSFRRRQEFLWTNLLEKISERMCPRRRQGSNRKSVITFRDPDDFLKYKSVVS